jgi:hypothetical protein
MGAHGFPLFTTSLFDQQLDLPRFLYTLLALVSGQDTYLSFYGSGWLILTIVTLVQ